MLTHIAKLIWNTRSTRLLLAGQILLSFLVLFSVFSFVGDKFVDYVTPLGFDVVDSYKVSVELPEAIDTVATERKALFERLRLEVEAIPEVVRVANVGFIAPFDNSQWGWGEDNDGIHIWTRLLMVDQHYGEAAKLPLARGRWFTPSDTINGALGIVVNEEWLAYNFAGNDMLDSTINFFNTEENGTRATKIVGVVKNYKYLGEFAEEEAITFVPHAPWDPQNEENYWQGLQVRVAPGTAAAIEEEIFEVVSAVTGSRESVIQPLEQRRVSTSKAHWVPILLLLSICTFLVVNVALGLFGILINAIAKRRGEIGLRKAMGATGFSVTSQLTTEVGLVALSGLVVGALIALQIYYLELLPIEGTMLLYGAVAAAGLILVLIILCAAIPSSQAARIHPATALRED